VGVFGTVLIVVVALAIVAAGLSFLGAGRVYSGLGRTGLALDEPDTRAGPAPGTAAYDAEAQAEIRQMLEAKSERMQARGEQALDVDSELAELTRPRADPGLRAEIRQLVIARNERRARRGEAALDVDAAVEEELRRLT